MPERCEECRRHAEAWASPESEAILDTIEALLGEAQLRRPPAQRPCAWCGNEMVHLGGRSDRKHCSGACRVAAHRARHRAPQPERPCRECEWCTACIRRRRPDAKYCSNACKQAAYRTYRVLRLPPELLEGAVHLVRNADTPERMKVLAETFPPELLRAARMLAELEQVSQ